MKAGEAAIAAATCILFVLFLVWAFFAFRDCVAGGGTLSFCLLAVT